MLLQVLVVVGVLSSSQGYPRPESNPQPKIQQEKSADPRQLQQLLYVPERQYSPDLNYDLGLLEAQFHYPYNFLDKQPAPTYPRVQPQIILYSGNAAPGQPFLLQPGGAPPGNFLVPQPGPNVILRDSPQPHPQPPLFVAGYPKPAHIPPIEKDAEEVPTNPSKIPPLAPKDTASGGKTKPEKLETFDEPQEERKPEVYQPSFNPTPNLRPGQRFFILNGQPLFSNYPYNQQVYPVNPKYQSPLFLPQHQPQIPQEFLLRSAIPEPQRHYPENLILLNQNDGPFQDIPQTKDIKIGDLLQLQQDNIDQENEAIIIDAREQDEANTENASEGVKSVEPTIAQAHPGAIALAGPGGVASSAPRGNAFVGKEGLAVSSPQATAVAGPSREQYQDNEKKDQKKRKN